MDKNYLTEKSLGDALLRIFPKHEFVHNKQVPESGIRNRPDYRCDELKMIIEFDGHRHYTEAKVIIKDIETEEVWSKMGYHTIRIPYFIQLTRELINRVFFWQFDYDDYDIGEWEQVYPHGFVDSKCILPADFCSLGLKRFMSDLDSFHNESRDIMKSLEDKCENKSPLEVYPDMLMNQMDLSNAFESMIYDLTDEESEDNIEDIIGAQLDALNFWLNQMNNHNTYDMMKMNLNKSDKLNHYSKMRYFPEYYKQLRDLNPKLFENHIPPL